MVGRLKFVAVPLDEHIEQFEKPELTYKPDPHKMDAAGEVCGMLGIEVATILALALDETPQNEMLAKAFKDFMMIGKMLFSEQSSKAKADWMNAARARAATDRLYQSAQAAYKAKVRALNFKWNEVNGQLRKLWVSAINDLAEMVGEDPSLETMQYRDRELIKLLIDETIDLIEIADEQVSKFERKVLCQLDNDKINNVLNRLADKTTISGRF
jgi:hypothetical protein